MMFQDTCMHEQDILVTVKRKQITRNSIIVHKHVINNYNNVILHGKGDVILYYKRNYSNSILYVNLLSLLANIDRMHMYTNRSNKSRSTQRPERIAYHYMVSEVKDNRKIKPYQLTGN